MGAWFMDLHTRLTLSCLIQVHNQALCICLGACQSSPRDSLCVEANEPPLALRRTKLALQYCLKQKLSPANPAYSFVFQPKFQDRFEGNPERGLLGIRMKPHLENLDLDTFPVSQVDLQKFACQQNLPKYLVSSRNSQCVLCYCELWYHCVFQSKLN